MRIIAIRTADHKRYSLCCIAGTHFLMTLPNVATYHTLLPWTKIHAIIEGLPVANDGQVIDPTHYTWQAEE